MPDLMSTDEAAALIHRTPETLRYWRHIGEGPPFFKVGRIAVYDRAEFIAWTETQKAKTIYVSGRR